MDLVPPAEPATDCPDCERTRRRIEAWKANLTVNSTLVAVGGAALWGFLGWMDGRRGLGLVAMAAIGAAAGLAIARSPARLRRAQCPACLRRCPSCGGSQTTDVRGARLSTGMTAAATILGTIAGAFVMLAIGFMGAMWGTPMKPWTWVVGGLLGGALGLSSGMVFTTGFRQPNAVSRRLRCRSCGLSWSRAP